MTTELSAAWPEERRAQAAPTPTQAYLDQLREEALDALRHSRFGQAAVTSVAAWLRAVRDADERLPGRGDLGEALVQALDSSRLRADAATLREELDRSADDHDVAPAVAALAALGALSLLRHETVERSWRVVSNLRRYDNRLRPAMNAALAAALRDEQDFKERFFDLAEHFVTAAIQAPERQVMAHERDMYARVLEDWNNGPALQELWAGLRGLDYVHHLSEANEVLAEVARLDPPRFVDLLQRFDNPYSVASAIERTAAARHFEVWRSFVEATPVAFQPDGSWTGSVILPLLLVVAAQAVARGGAPFVHHQTAGEAEAAGTEMAQSAEQIAAILLAREDGPPAALRWAARLAREVMGASADGPALPTDARGRAFAPWRILIAIAQRAGFDTWRTLVPPDMPAEEAWFSLMAKAVAAPQTSASTQIHMDLFDTFAAAWPDSDAPEAWQGAPGASLRQYGGVVSTFGRQPSNLGVRLLAIPMTLGPDPAAAWASLWRRCAVLREAVEFAEPRLAVSSSDDRPWAPAELCWLIVNLGLGSIDQIVDERIDLPYDRGPMLSALLPQLWDASAEMLAIDRFGRETWDRARRHLAIRRGLFAADRASGSGPRIIPAEAQPTLAEMLRVTAGAEPAFFTLLGNLLDAGIEAGALGSALTEAGVDLDHLLDAAERISAVDERRSVVGPHEAERLRRLQP
jgi:hypothetical protein